MDLGGVSLVIEQVAPRLQGLLTLMRRDVQPVDGVVGDRRDLQLRLGVLERPLVPLSFYSQYLSFWPNVFWSLLPEIAAQYPPSRALGPARRLGSQVPAASPCALARASAGLQSLALHTCHSVPRPVRPIEVAQ